MNGIPTGDEMKAAQKTLKKMAEALKGTGYALGAIYFPYFPSEQGNKWIVETVDEDGYVWEHEGATLGDAWEKASEWPGNMNQEKSNGD